MLAAGPSSAPGTTERAEVGGAPPAAGSARERRRCVVPVAERRQPRRPARRRRRPRRRPACATTVDGLVLRSVATSPTATHRVRIAAQPSGIFGDSVDDAFSILIDTHRPALALDQVPRGLAAASRDRAGAPSTARRSPCARRAGASSAGDATARSRSIPACPTAARRVRLTRATAPATARVITRTVTVDRTPPRRRTSIASGASSARRTRRCAARSTTPRRWRAGDARRRLGRAARRRRQAAARRAARSGPLLAAARARSPRACTSSRHGDRRRRQHETVQRRGPSPSTRPRSCAPSVRWRSAPAARTSCSSSAGCKAFGLYKGPFTRFYNARTAAAVQRFQASTRPAAVTGIADARACSSSAPSASSCT